MSDTATPPQWAVDLARQVGELSTRFSLLSAIQGIRPVITADEVNMLIGAGSASARQRWIAKWAPKSVVEHGKYNFIAIKRGMDAWAKSSPAKRISQQPTTAVSTK